MGRRSARGAPGWGVGTWLQLLDLAPHWPGAGPAPSHPLQQLLAGCGCALLGLAVGGSPPPGGHNLVDQADTLPGAPLPREAQKVTSNLVLKDEQGFVSQDRARTKALEAGGQAADPRVAEPGGLAPRPARAAAWPSWAVVAMPSTGPQRPPTGPRARPLLSAQLRTPSRSSCCPGPRSRRQDQDWDGTGPGAGGCSRPRGTSGQNS